MPPTPPPDPLPSKPLSDPSRKSIRNRKSRAFLDPSATTTTSTHKSWSETDELALLKAAVRFRARTGAAPRTPDMEEFFDSVRESLAAGMDQVRVFYKLKRLKSKFVMGDGRVNGPPHERLLHRLSAEVWGSDATGKGKRGKEDVTAETGDGRVDCEFMTEALREYLRENGGVSSSGVLLEDGLRRMNPDRAVKLERRWREQMEADVRLKMKRHEVFKEVYGLLAHAVNNSDLVLCRGNRVVRIPRILLIIEV